MHQKVTKDDIKKIAGKAMLDLSEKELEKYEKEFGAIFEFIDQIKKVNTNGVKPTYQVNGLYNIIREDKPIYCKEEIRKKIIANFPEKEGSLLKMPKVL